MPNLAARSLASHRSRTIALIIPEDTAAFFADPFYAALVPAVAKSLSTTDYTLTLVIASEAEPGKMRRHLLSGNVDGAVVLSHHVRDLVYAEVARSLPTLFSGRPPGSRDPHIYMVDIDNVGAAEEATRYLLAHGRQRPLRTESQSAAHYDRAARHHARHDDRRIAGAPHRRGGDRSAHPHPDHAHRARECLGWRCV